MIRSVLINKIVSSEGIPQASVLSEKGHVYTFLNPVAYLKALKCKELYNQFDGIFADGFLLVKSIRLIYGECITRRSCDMTSMGLQLFELSVNSDKTIYFVGEKQEDVEKAVTMFRKRFKGTNIIGYRNGYFANDNEMDEEVRHIVEVNPNFLVVGMGAIKQEEFLLRVKDAGYQGIGFTCGGFIRQTAHNDIDFYPAWVDKTNIRFLYRMWKEPHTRKRYLVAGLVFPIRFVWERFFG